MRLLLVWIAASCAITADAEPTVQPLADTQLPTDTLSQQRAIALAISRDPYLRGSQLRQSAMQAESRAATHLPNPKLSLTAANLPTDSFDFGQEPMTQIMVGVSQSFPRGNSRALLSRQQQQLSQQQPWLRADRSSIVALKVKQLWLALYRSERSIDLISADRSLFEQLVDVAEVSYASALVRSGQQDLIRAQLEVTAIEDRLTTLALAADRARQQLAEWVGEPALSAPLPMTLPEIEPIVRESASNADVLNQHPALRTMAAQIEAMDTGSELVRQRFKPEWGLSAQYGYRDNDPMGRDRADFISIGVSLDLPWLRSERTSQELSAAIDRAEAMRSDYALIQRQLSVQEHTVRAQLRRVEQRLGLYELTLLPQTHELAEAALNAYNNDEGEFAEAVRAQIAELNAKIELLSIRIEKRDLHAQLAYLLNPTMDADLHLEGGMGNE